MLILNQRNSPFWKVLEYIFYAFIVIFPFLNLNTFLYGGSSVRFVTLSLLSIGFAVLLSIQLFKKDSNLSVPKSPIFLSLVIYFAFLVISALFGLDFSTSFWSVATRTTGILYLINLGFIIYIASCIFSDRFRQNRMILVTILSTALFSFLSFLSPEGINLLFKGFKADAFTFGNSTFAGMYIFGAFLLSIYYLLQSEKKKWWMYILPLAIVINPNIINSSIWSGDISTGFAGEARASAYITALSLVFIFVIWCISKIKDIKKRSITTYSVFGLSILLMVVSVFSLLSHDGYLRKLYLSQATGARPLVWEMSEKVISQRPVLGWGTDNFERVFEVNYDNRLLQDDYGSEAWFDRAHNVLIDQLVDNGFVGLIFYILVYIAVILCLLYTTLKSGDKKDRIFASILIVYFSLHFVELQTAFDTTISYFMVALMIAFASVLYGRTRTQILKKEDEWEIGGVYKYFVASISLIFFVWSFVWGLIPFIRTQIANGTIRTVGTSEGRLLEYPILFKSPIDEHSFLWRTTTDFQKAISQNPKILEDAQKVASLKKEIIVFENAYKDYVQKNPKHFRARLNLADVLIYERLFGIDKLKEAQEVLDEAIKMAPQVPQSYWMKAVAYIYMKKFDLAREYAQKGLVLNPKISQSQDVVKYVEKSIKDFPNIDLYFFKQI